MYDKMQILAFLCTVLHLSALAIYEHFFQFRLFLANSTLGEILFNWEYTYVIDLIFGIMPIRTFEFYFKSKAFI